MELFNSVGIELEVEDVRGENLNLGNLNFRVHRDASCESDGYSIMGMKLDLEESDKTLLKYISTGRQTFGCELVTAGTLDTADLNYLYTLKQITSRLNVLGESPKSYRAGFHVHINVAYNLKILKSILRLARHLEQVLYLLGGMGYDYRGFKNSSAYCRPITKYGPVCVKTGWDNYSQVFTLGELLKSETTAEFKTRYGNVDGLKNSHYIPIRYHGLNLLPLFIQGSLEFRMFNKSLNPYYLMAIMEFCKTFSEYAVKSSFGTLKEENLLKENSIFDVVGEEDRGQILETFTHFLELSNLENKEVIEILYEILNTSSVDSLVTPKQYTFSHLIFHRQGNKSPIHWKNREFKPRVIDENSIKVPEFEDLHVLRENAERDIVGNRTGGGMGINNINRIRQWENPDERRQEFDEEGNPIFGEEEDTGENTRQTQQYFTDNNYTQNVTATTNAGNMADLNAELERARRGIEDAQAQTPEISYEDAISNTMENVREQTLPQGGRLRTVVLTGGRRVSYRRIQNPETGRYSWEQIVPRRINRNENGE